MKLRLFLTRGIGSLALAVPLLVLFFVLRYLFAVWLGFSPLPAVIAAAVIAGGMLPVLENLKRAYLDKYLLKTGSYDRTTAVTRFGDQMRNVIDIEELERYVVMNLSDIMASDGATIFLSDEHGWEYFRGHSHGSLDGWGVKKLDRDDELIVKLKDNPEILKISETRVPRKDELKKTGVEIVAPLLAKESLVGVILLGHKQRGGDYSSRDLAILHILANHAVTAFENARLFSKVLQVKNHMETVLDNMASGVVTMDTSRRITTVNRGARKILGLEEHDLVGREVAVLGKTLGLMMLEHLTSRKGMVEKEVTVTTEERGRIDLNVMVRHLKERDEVTGVLMCFDDLSHIRTLEERVRRGDRLASVGMLAASMAHEIKNPLVSIKTFSQLLNERYDDKEFRENFANIAIKEVDRINDIVEKLLNFAKPVRVSLERNDLHGILDHALGLIEEEAARRNINITKQYANEDAVLPVDSHLIQQVFLNLFLNAVQAIEKDGKVSVTTEFISTEEPEERKVSEEAGRDESKGRLFRLKVVDTGKGIMKEHMKYLFEPFYTTKTKGFGLGLSMAQEIVKEHGGKIDVASRPGEGTTFTVTLPISEDE